MNAKTADSVAQNVLNALNEIAANLDTWQIVDPANTNNIISEQHTDDEKKKIMAQAAASAKANWNQIIW